MINEKAISSSIVEIGDETPTQLQERMLYELE
jgi:hypothetical protein